MTDGLAPMRQPHSGGLAATRPLTDLARITKGEKVLPAVRSWLRI